MGLLDITGQKFGHWTVLRKAPKLPHYNEAYWVVRCVCGFERILCRSNLRGGGTTSCGCMSGQHRRLLTHCGETLALREWSERTGLRVETIANRYHRWPDDAERILGQRYLRQHGMSKSHEYAQWTSMVARCGENGLPGYVGRGIRVCPRWRESFAEFIRDMGPKPSPKHEVDRKDNNGGYWCGKCDECMAAGRPPNCRWATRSEQCNNTRRNVRITFDGVTLTQTQWARRLGFKRGVIESRLRKGLPMDEVLSPKRSKRGPYKTKRAPSARAKGATERTET